MYNLSDDDNVDNIPNVNLEKFKLFLKRLPRNIFTFLCITWRIAKPFVKVLLFFAAFCLSGTGNSRNHSEENNFSYVGHRQAKRWIREHNKTFRH